MRAYLINPSERSIIEVDIEEDDVGELLGFDGTKQGAVLGAVGLTPVEEENFGGSGDYLSDYLYVPPPYSFEEYDNSPPGTVSDDRKIKGDPRDWFQILRSSVDPKQPASFPYPCCGIIVGLDCDGHWISSGLRPSEVRERVKFIHGKLAGYTTSTAIEKDLTWTGPMVEPIDEPDSVVKLKKVAR